MAVKWPKTPVGGGLPLSVPHPPNLPGGVPNGAGSVPSLPRGVPGLEGGIPGSTTREEGAPRNRAAGRGGLMDEEQMVGGVGDGAVDDGATLSEDIELAERRRASEDDMRVRVRVGKLGSGEQMV